MLKALGSKVIPVAVAIAVESRYITSPLNNQRLFGLVIISNVIASGFTLMIFRLKSWQSKRYI